MSAYWADYVRLMMPGFLWTTASALPLALATALAAIHLGRRKPGPYRRNLWASTAAGVVAFGLLFEALFGEGLKGSTAGLIFLFVPIYSAVALGVGYGLGALAHRRAGHMTETAISQNEGRFIALPLIILVALLFGMLKYSIQHNDLTVAERATNLETLRSINQRAHSGMADRFGVPLFLAQNPNTPTDILEGLSRHDHVSVRIFVVRHSNTSRAAIEHMVNDCDARIREEARARLQLASASNSALQPTPNCRRG
jgi:hypothetical protein